MPRQYFFFNHPLERPGKPGRWPFWACYKTIEGKKAQGFLYLDGRGPGLLNSNMDPCVLSDPLPWFLAHCRLDELKKRHNQVIYPDGSLGKLLSQEVSPGDIIFFGGVLGPGSEDCACCSQPCKDYLLWVDTIFTVGHKIPLPLNSTKEGLFSHALGTKAGYRKFRQAISKALGRDLLPKDLEEFKETSAWVFNLADTENRHTSVDYKPYYLLLGSLKEQDSFLPLASPSETSCPLLKRRPGLFWLKWPSFLRNPWTLFPLVDDNQSGVCALTEEEGATLFSWIKQNAQSLVTKVFDIFYYRLEGAPKPYRITVSETLRRYGFSQREVASWGAIQFVTLNKISRQEVPPTLQTLSRIAQAVGCGMKDLFEEPEGDLRPLFHRIARCQFYKAAHQFPRAKNPCQKVFKNRGSQKQVNIICPEPWNGSLAEAKVVFLGLSPDYKALKAWLLDQGVEYPHLDQKAWYPGRVETFFKERFFHPEYLPLGDKAFYQALEQGQLFLKAGDSVANLSLTFLSHCHGVRGGSALEHCLSRFLPEILQHVSGLLVVLPEATEAIASLLAEQGLLVKEFEEASLWLLPSHDDSPLLSFEDWQSQSSWEKLFERCKGLPRLALLFNKCIKSPASWLQTIQCFTRKKHLEAFSFWQWAPKALVARALFRKIALCPEIRAHLEGRLDSPCHDLFFSYGAIALDDIFFPLPWAGNLLKAPVLCVGFKAPLKKKIYPRYHFASVEAAQAYFEEALQKNEAPYIYPKHILEELLGVEGLGKLSQSEPRAKNILSQFLAYFPLVRCRNALGEGSFPANIYRTCRDRYLGHTLALSGAKVVVIQGRRASLAVMEALGLERDLGKGFVHELPVLGKTLVFLPSAKGGLEDLPPEEKEKIRPLRQELREKFLQHLLKEFTPLAIKRIL